MRCYPQILMHFFRQFIASAVVGILSLQTMPIPSGFALESQLVNESQPGRSVSVYGQEFANEYVQQYVAPIDALSVTLPDANAQIEIGYWDGKSWSAWQRAQPDKEDNPDSLESDLIMFDVPVTRVRIRGAASLSALHPIRVSHDPAMYKVTSLVSTSEPHIYSRSEWGADRSLMINGGANSSAANANGENGSAAPPTQRVLDCQQAQADFPQEFRVSNTVTKDGNGKSYLWPQSYSSVAKLFVVHHTAGAISGDKRSGEERMRAIYQYHAKTMGWGDIGYHYVIDEQGHIYEGRAGGKLVVGGHAYCHNVGTIGVALMGNFESEQPQQAQIHALQWLLKDLAVQYGIDVNHSAVLQGKTYASPIVRHRDLLSTACPGFYLAESFTQVVSHVQGNDLSADVKFPALPPIVNVKEKPMTSVVSSAGSGPVTQIVPGLISHGGTDIRLNPGGVRRFDISYIAQASGARAGSRIAQVVRSSPGIGILLDSETGRSDVRGALVLSKSLAAGDEERFELLLTAPYDQGSFWFEIGGIRYTLQAIGRRSRLMTVPQSVSVFTSPLYSQPLSVQPSVSNRSAPANRVTGRTISSSSSLAPRSPPRADEVGSQTSNSSYSSTSSSSSTSSPTIRVRLSIDALPLVSFTAGGTMGGQTVAGNRSVNVSAKGTLCVASVGGNVIASRSVLTAVPATGGLTAVENVNGAKRLYRGSIECRVIDGRAVLINELPLEDYMLGLSEEPDSEPYEKQRAFAIAARTYALYYSDPLHRKFPGLPYDASDSPALFQSYTGVTFERNNPRWLTAVSHTSRQVLIYKSQVLRVPYFSSDDGRTRSPIEAGWKNFPNAEVFVSKADPWCSGKPLSGHGVGMSGCGAKAQAIEGKIAEQILQYYYPGTTIEVR